MIFKGTLGTDGTITDLPTASEYNEGFTYKVITAGTYASIAAKVGDTFISDGIEWVLVPSGDEPNGTVTNVAATGSNGITISGSPITTSGTLNIGLNLSTAINGLTLGSSPAQGADYLVAQYAGGGTTTTTYHRRSVNNVVNKTVVDTALGKGSDTTKYYRNDGAWATPTDTKNTAGSTDTSSKIFLIGATS
jgi:hypothetical protein